MMKHPRLVHLLAVALVLPLLVGLVACTPGPSVARVNTQVPTTSPSALEPVAAADAQGQPPDTVPAAVPTEDLIAQVAAGLPKDAFGGIQALPLAVAEGAEPLWVVISTGQINFDLQPLPSHFLAIYTLAGDVWKELAHLDLDLDTGGPTYLQDDASQQVDLEPGHVWFAVSGGMGAHGGTFHLVSFDGQVLRVEASMQSPSPGMGSVYDVDGDGTLEVVLDQSDPYIFCYACGARKVQFQVLYWDATQGKLEAAELEPLPAGLPESVTGPANRAVELARAGLWKGAYARIREASEAAQGVPGDKTALKWDEVIIRLHAEALAETLTIEYPLIQQVFYGDYDAAVEIMRQFKPEEIFSAESPLVADPGVQPFVESLSQHLVESATQALKAEPDLAAAYFVRGWGEYLADAASRQARDDVAKAATLAPDDSLYTGSVAVLE